MYENKTIIQIGSHVGNTINDPIFNQVDKTTTLILIEPVPYLFEQLKENYKNKNIDELHFINKAVSSYVGNIELTIPSQNNDFSKFPFYASQLSSVNETHAVKHFPNLITKKITVPTTTLDEIVKDYNIKEIEVLYSDTEGHDYDIIMNYSFTVKPFKILFEHKHMDGIELNGNKDPKGERYNALVDKLNSLGYKLKFRDSEDTLVQLSSPIDIIKNNRLSKDM